MRVKNALSVGFFALSTALAAPAFAQNAPATPAPATPSPAADQGAGPDIVVTAQFRETRLQDTPLAITAVNAALLEERGQTSITQVAAQAPNVTLRPQPQNGGSGLIAFIRGVGQVDFNYALDPGVGVYIDDVYIPTLSSSLLDLMDLDRIEILRGPQGTLAGKNSIGGAIKLFSEKPDGSGKGSVSVGYGSFNKLDIRGMADFALTDNLFARVSGVAKSSKGYVDVLDYARSHPGSNVPATDARGANSVVGTQGGQSYVAARLALRWEPVDTVEVNLSGDLTSDHSEPAPTIVLAAGLPGPSSTKSQCLRSKPALSRDQRQWRRLAAGRQRQPRPARLPFRALWQVRLRHAQFRVDRRRPALRDLCQFPRRHDPDLAGAVQALRCPAEPGFRRLGHSRQCGDRPERQPPAGLDQQLARI